MNKVVYDQIMIAAINWLRNIFKQAGWKIDIGEYDVGNDTTDLQYEFTSENNVDQVFYSPKSIGVLLKNCSIKPIQDAIQKISNGYIDRALLASPSFIQFLSDYMYPVNYNDYTRTSFAPFVDRLGENKQIGLDEIGLLIDLMNICDNKESCVFDVLNDNKTFVIVHKSSFLFDMTKINEKISELNKKLDQDERIEMSYELFHNGVEIYPSIAECSHHIVYEMQTQNA